MPVKYDTIRWSFESDTQVGTITLNRPDSLNAFSPALRRELAAGLMRLKEIDADPNRERVEAVVVEGAGDRAFSVGADVNESKELDPWAKEFRTECLLPPELPMPVLAKIDGYCLGAGLEFALACDFRLASSKSELGLPESRLGILPANGGIQRLAAQTGPSRAKELVMSGERIGADEALADGIVDRVCSTSELDELVDTFLNRVTSGAPLAVRAAKDVIDVGRRTNLRSAIDYEHRISRSLRATRDYEEGRKAFSEDRDPEWEGR